MDFSTSAKSRATTSRRAARSQQDGRCAARSTSSPTTARDALADRVRQGHAARPLSAARRELPGSVRARRLGLCRRRRPRPARLRLYLASCGSCRRPRCCRNGGTGRGLPISCYLNSVSDSLEGIVGTWNENVWLASQGRRHRHLLGPRARHRRAGRPQRQDQRHHPVRPRDGQPDAGDFARARCGAARPPATSTSRTPRSRSSSKSANRRATSTARRSTSTTACSSPTSSWRRCATAPSSCCASPKDGVGARHGRCALAVPEAGRDPPRDRRAVHHLHRPVNRSMPKHHRDLGLKVTTSNLCSRDHAADRQGPSRRRPHRGLLPVSRSTSRPGTSGTATSSFIEDVMRFLDNVLCRLHRPRARRDGARQVQRRARAQRRPRRDGLPLASSRRAASRSKGRWPRAGTSRSSSISAPRSTKPR